MTANPHDALFKAVLGDPEHARGALRAVVPAALREAVDWATLAREPGSFVDPALRERHTDLLFSAQLTGGGGALVYVVFEHQSTPDALMAYRLLRYAVRVWERWLAREPGAARLPPIVPVVLYHGGAPWTAARCFADLIAVPAELAAATRSLSPQFCYLLDDLSAVSDDDLRARAAAAAGTAAATAALVCFKYGRSETDMVAVLARFTDVLRNVVAAPNGLEALAVVMRYILLVNDHARPEALQELLERGVGPQAKETVVTVGQQLIEQGKLEGRLQGRLEGERALLLRQLRMRFGHELDAEAEQRVAAASAEQLERWALGVLSAGSLDELLRD